MIFEFLESEKEINVEINKLNKEIEIVNNFINSRVNYNPIIIDKFIIGLTYFELTSEYNYSKSQIFKIIENEISMHFDYQK